MKFHFISFRSITGHNAAVAYSGTLRDSRSGPMSPAIGATSSKYLTNAGIGMHKYQYDFQNPELIYPQPAGPQQFHQMHTGKLDHKTTTLIQEMI